MAAPKEPHAPRVVDPLDVRALYDAVLVFVSDALVRLGCHEADRADVAQQIILKAHRAWHQYDPARGSPARWLWAIIRNERRTFERPRTRAALLAALAPAFDPRADAQTPEDIVLLEDLRAFVWKDVPDVERRILCERRIGDTSWEEIAALEGISSSTAKRLYAKGEKRLQAALERAEERKLRGAAVPIVLADLFELGHGIHVSEEARERGWQALLVEMGRGDAPAADDDDAPPSSRPRAWPPVLRRVLGPIAGMVAGALLAGPMLSRCDRDRGHRERLVPALAAEPAMFVPRAVTESADPGSGAYLANVVNNAGPRLAPIAEGAGGESGPADHVPGPRRDAWIQDEGSFLDQGRAALAANNVAGALLAVGEHARRFPGGRLADEREALRAQACARLFAVAHGDAAKIDAQCAAKPLAAGAAHRAGKK